MDIIRKEKEILEKLRDSGYSRFRGDKNAALDYLAEQMEKIMAYDGDAVREQIRSRLQGNVAQTQESQKDVMASEGIVSGLKALNGLCADLELEPFTDIDMEDRQAVAAFIGQCRMDLYSRGIGGHHS